MNSTILYLLLAIGVLIIAVLAVVAWRLQSKVREQERRRQELQEQQEAKTAERNAFVLDSLRILSTNVLEEGLNLSEATIRCKILVDALDLPQDERQSYQILDIVYERVQQFDTHQARKALSSEERRRQDEEREAIEAEFEPELKLCFSRLKTIGIQ